MPKKAKRKGGMLIVRGVRASAKKPKHNPTDYDPEDPAPFRIPEHVKQAYNNVMGASAPDA